MEKIHRVSRFLKGFFSVMVILAPLFLVFYWTFFNELLELGWGGVINGVKTQTLPMVTPVKAWTRVLAFVVSVPSLAVDVYAMIKLRQLFSLYMQGLFFTSKNVSCIKAIGYALIAGQLINPFIQAFLTVVLTLSNPPGERMIQIGVSNANFTALVSGIMIIVVAWIMDEGRKIQEEQALTV